MNAPLSKTVLILRYPRQRRIRAVKITVVSILAAAVVAWLVIR